MIAMLASTVLSLLKTHFGESLPVSIAAKIIARLPDLLDLAKDFADDGTLSAAGLNKLSVLVLDARANRL